MKTIVALLSLFLLIGCENNDSDNNMNSNKDDISSVKTGVFFGMSYGYGFADLEIKPDELILILTSAQSDKFPRVTRKYPFTLNKWKDLINQLDSDEFFSLQAIYGCPDCADGGGEYIEITLGDKKYKTTFDYGKNISEIQGFQEELRNIFKDVHQEKN